MIQFIINRLKSVLSSVFIITVISFGLLHLVPIQDSILVSHGSIKLSPISKEIVEEFKKYHFLDYPIFINFDPKDRRYYLNKYFFQFLKGERRGFKRLVELKGTAIPFLLKRFNGLDREQKEKMALLLDKIVDGIEELKKERKKWDKGSISFWENFWEVYQLDYTKERVRLLIKRIIKYDDKLSREEILKLDTFSIDIIMEYLLEEELPYKIKRRLSELAYKITGRGSILPETQNDKEEIERIMEDWIQWWQLNYRYYTDFKGFKKITSIFTETQYFKWLSKIVRLDFGRSIRDNRKIIDKIKEKIWVTLTITLLATLLSYILAIPLGAFLGLKDGTKIEKVLSTFLFISYCLPIFWVAPILLNIFAFKFHIFPSGGILSPEYESAPFLLKLKDVIYHIILPVISLSYVSVAFLSRYQKTAFLEILEKDFIRTAKAMGFGKWKVALVYGLRSAILPIITLFGLQFPFLISGSVIVEKVFQLPGIGLETFEAIKYMDYNWIMGMITIVSVVTVIGLLISDILLYIADPRVRESFKKEVS